jgi:hypothetical protein
MIAVKEGVKATDLLSKPRSYGRMTVRVAISIVHRYCPGQGSLSALADVTVLCRWLGVIEH